jgi:glycosyltransferase involved in cell wall biosynthesis
VAFDDQRLERRAAGPSRSIVLCTRDRPALLAEALEAIGPLLVPGDELVVVDSASSTRDSVALARRAGAVVIEASRPGLAVARNLGIVAARGEVLAFTDDDCRPSESWLDRLTAPFVDPGLAFATGSVRADLGRLRFLEHDEAREFRLPVDPIDVGAGANMAIRRSALLDIGGFDERLGAGTALRSSEDHDVFLRLLRAGWRGAAVPDALVVHHDWRTRWQAARLQWGTGLGTGAMVAKDARLHGWRSSWPLLRRRLGSDGIAAIGRDIARGWEVPAAAEVLKLSGTVAGLAVGRALRINANGRFR